MSRRGGCQVSCRCRTAAWGGRPTGSASAPIGMGGFTSRQQFKLLGENRTALSISCDPCILRSVLQMITIHVHALTQATLPPLPPAHCAFSTAHAYIRTALQLWNAFAVCIVVYLVPITVGRIYFSMIMIDGMGGWDPPPWDQRLCTYINAAAEPSRARNRGLVCMYTTDMRSHFGPSG